jgi:hypothetical protein
MEMSEHINELAAALAKAQATIGGAIKDAVNPAFRSKYADLASVWDAWQKVGPAQGLSVTQLPGAMVDGKVTLVTMLMHQSGQWLSQTLAIPVTKQDAQGYGSALTYARRYALAALAGIAPEDDDGNAAVAKREVPNDTNPKAADPAGAEDLGEKWAEWAEQSVKNIRAMDFDAEALASWWSDNKTRLNTCKKHSPAAYDTLVEFKDQRKAELSANAPNYLNAG